MVPLLNFRRVPGPTFKFWGGSWVPGSRILRSRVPGSWSHFYTMLLLPFTLFRQSIFYKYLKSIISSSHPEVFLRKGVLKICNKFTGENPCRSAISIKLLCNFIEITLPHGCSPVDLLHIFSQLFLRTPLHGRFCISTFLLNVSSRSAFLLKGPAVFSKQKTFLSVCIAFYFFSNCWF